MALRSSRASVLGFMAMLALALVIGAFCAGNANAAQEPVDVAREAARYYGLSEYLFANAMACESVGFDPAVAAGLRVGPAGEQGPAQLHPRGRHLPMFYAETDREGDRYTNHYSWWQAFDFAAKHISQGDEYGWSCWRVVRTVSPSRWWWRVIS